ncbi:MAG: cupin domain-containing protein [Kiloniellales bacterium]
MNQTKVTTFASRSQDAHWEEGLRPYFVYRDLGVREATAGKVLAHVIRANEPCAGPMGYHSHQLDFQMVYMLKGSSRMYFEDVGEIEVKAGDAWFQPPGVRHEVLDYSDDFEVLEITMPADFATASEQR